MIGAIVLAAGRSRRMGTQKLLLPIAGRPLIARVVDEILRSPVDKVVVVAGADSGRIAAVLAGRRIDIVVNPDADGDMLSSVRCGLRALPSACNAVLVALGDQPGITAELVARLVKSFCDGAGEIVVPVHGQRRGHPLLLAARFRDEVLRTFDGVGLRGLLAAYPESIAEVKVGALRELDDVDTPEDFRRLVDDLTAEDKNAGPQITSR